MNIEFRITQYDEERCYSNNSADLKSFLTALYSAEHPYGALMNLDGNERLDPADYAHDEQSGRITYDINFDNDTITRHEKGKQFKLNELSKIPLGAAYSLLGFHGKNIQWEASSDFEFVEFDDMLGLFGNGDPETKERGFVNFGNDEFFEAYLNYLKNTGGYKFIRSVDVNGAQYLAFDQRGFDNIKTFLLQKFHAKQAEANRLKAEINMAFGISEPFEMSVSRQQGDRAVTVTLTADEMRRAYYIVHESFLTEDIQMKLDDLANDDSRYENLSNDIDFVNGVLSRYTDHSEPEISYNDNILNAIEHEMAKRENSPKRETTSPLETAARKTIATETLKKERNVTDAFKVLSSFRINDNLEIVLGRRTTQFGTDYATWECSNGNNYYWGHYGYQSEWEAQIDMCKRVVERLESIHPVMSEIDKMRASSNINFSVVNINGEMAYFSGSYVTEDNIDNDEEYLSYVEDCCDNELNITVDYYNWGDKIGDEAKDAAPEQLKLLRENWDTESNRATTIESGRSFTVDLECEDERDMEY